MVVEIYLPSACSVLAEAGDKERSVPINSMSHDLGVLVIIYRLHFVYRAIGEAAARDNGQFLARNEPLFCLS
jgi:hypothetical protein